MDSSEAILGLGSHAGRELVELSGLDEQSSNMVGPEFTYFGVFLSALAYKEVNDPNLNVEAASLASLKSLHSQVEKSNAELLDLVASLSFASYSEAVEAWPSSGERAVVAIKLCDLLARLLRSSAKIDLTVLQKTKLRARVEDLFDVLEIAHREMRNAFKSDGTPSSIKTMPKPADRSQIGNIQTAKSALFRQFDDGDITAEEYCQGLDALNQKELSVHLEVAKKIYAKSNLWDNRFAVIVVAAFLLGFLVGPFLYPILFGYKNAEECVLNAKHKYAVGACYDLYPSIQK